MVKLISNARVNNVHPNSTSEQEDLISLFIGKVQIQLIRLPYSANIFNFSEGILWGLMAFNTLYICFTDIIILVIEELIGSLQEIIILEQIQLCLVDWLQM